MTVAAILADPHYTDLKTYILQQTGLHYYADKDEDFAARLSRRMTAHALTGCGEYLRMLTDDGVSTAERDALIGELTIGETYFFRQVEHFDLLRSTIIPDLLARNESTRRLRIWSAGCATGAEPYSIALLLRLEFFRALHGWDVSILGTDINADFLAQAKNARYGGWALREIPESLKACCFHQEGRNWLLHREYLDSVRFERHNLASPVPYPGATGDPFDLILCRNVLIYFSRESICTVANRLHDSLAPGGWLLVGHAEPNAESFSRFDLFSSSQVTAYRKRLAHEPFPIHEAVPQQLWQPPALLSDFNEATPSRKPVRRPEPVRRPVPDLPKPAPSSAAVPGTVEDARALADAGQWGEAADLCHRMIEADPLNGPAHFTLGVVLAHTGPADQAAAAFRRAIYLDRSFALAHYHLGVLLQSAGRNAEARRAFRNVIDILRTVPADDVLLHGDGIQAGELNELAAMHLNRTEAQ